MVLPLTISRNDIATAAGHLLAGRLVAMPTETVYGLAADATDPMAVAAIFAAKGRPSINPLIAHVVDLAAAEKLAVFSDTARSLAEEFWPGGLTLVLPRRGDCLVAELACAGLSTIAVRVPDHPVAQALLAATGRPLAAPSANTSGRPSPTHADHVLSDLGHHIAMVLDAGPCRIGLESTVVAVDGSRVTLLRPGAISVEHLETVCGPIQRITEFDHEAPPSPGMILRHYAPDAPVHLEQLDVPAGGIRLGFGSVGGIGPYGPDEAWSLSPAGDLHEAAARLFELLRAADLLAPSAIGVAPIPESGLGEAINDRLKRAANATRLEVQD